MEPAKLGPVPEHEAAVVEAEAGTLAVDSNAGIPSAVGSTDGRRPGPCTDTGSRRHCTVALVRREAPSLAVRFRR